MAHTRFLAGLLAVAGLLSACRSSPAPIPSGSGLASFDREPPPGVELVPRPTLTTGDWFTFRRGGLTRLRYRVIDVGAETEEAPEVVTEAEPGTPDVAYLFVDEDAQRALILDRDLCQLGEGVLSGPGGPLVPTTRLDPLDPSFSWPLWVGKRWSGDFVQRDGPKAQLPLVTYYEVQAKEQVRTPAGTFDAFRIERRASLTAEGDYIDRTNLMWYAPEVGYFVRRLDDSLLTELEEFHRQ